MYFFFWCYCCVCHRLRSTITTSFPAQRFRRKEADEESTATVRKICRSRGSSCRSGRMKRSQVKMPSWDAERNWRGFGGVLGTFGYYRFELLLVKSCFIKRKNNSRIDIQWKRIGVYPKCTTTGHFCFWLNKNPGESVFSGYKHTKIYDIPSCDFLVIQKTQIKRIVYFI